MADSQDASSSPRVEHKGATPPSCPTEDAHGRPWASLQHLQPAVLVEAASGLRDGMCDSSTSSAVLRDAAAAGPPPLLRLTPGAELNPPTRGRLLHHLRPAGDGSSCPSSPHTGARQRGGPPQSRRRRSLSQPARRPGGHGAPRTDAAVDRVLHYAALLDARRVVLLSTPSTARSHSGSTSGTSTARTSAAASAAAGSPPSRGAHSWGGPLPLGGSPPSRGAPEAPPRRPRAELGVWRASGGTAPPPAQRAMLALSLDKLRHNDSSGSSTLVSELSSHDVSKTHYIQALVGRELSRGLARDRRSTPSPPVSLVPSSEANDPAWRQPSASAGTSASLADSALSHSLDASGAPSLDLMQLPRATSLLAAMALNDASERPVPALPGAAPFDQPPQARAAGIDGIPYAPSRAPLGGLSPVEERASFHSGSLGDRGSGARFAALLSQHGAPSEGEPPPAADAASASGSGALQPLSDILAMYYDSRESVVPQCPSPFDAAAAACHEADGTFDARFAAGELPASHSSDLARELVASLEAGRRAQSAAGEGGWAGRVHPPGLDDGDSLSGAALGGWRRGPSDPGSPLSLRELGPWAGDRLNSAVIQSLRGRGPPAPPRRVRFAERFKRPPRGADSPSGDRPASGE